MSAQNHFSLHTKPKCFPGKLLKLSESGLDKLWFNWAEFWNAWNDTWEAARNETPPKSVSLYDSNVRVVFLLFIVLILVPVLIFLVEVFLFFLKRLVVTQIRWR